MHGRNSGEKNLKWGERLKSFFKNIRANFSDEAKIVTVC